MTFHKQMLPQSRGLCGEEKDRSAGSQPPVHPPRPAADSRQPQGQVQFPTCSCAACGLRIFLHGW